MFYVGLIISSLQLYEYPLGIRQCKQILIQLFIFIFFMLWGIFVMTSIADVYEHRLSASRPLCYS